MDIDYVPVRFSSQEQFTNAIAWCDEQGWEDDYVLGGLAMYFSNEQYATMCALRWAN